MAEQLLDKTGKAWSIEVTPYEYGLVERELDIRLYDIIAMGPVRGVDENGEPNPETDEEREEREAAERAALQKRLAVTEALESNKIVDILWLICKDEADESGINAKQFMKSWDGESLNKAFFAILKALKFFFTKRAEREMMDKMIAFCQAVQDRSTERTTQALEKLDPQLMGKRYVDSVISSRGSLGSTSKDQTEIVGVTPTANLKL